MKHFVLILALTSLVLSCGQNDNQKKELDLKEKELALKQKELELKEKEMSKQDSNLTKANVPPKSVQLKSEKEESWDAFWILFSNAVKQKNKVALLNLASKGDAFDGGAGGDSPEDWAGRMVGSEEGKYFISVINMGVKPDDIRGKGGKITKKHALYFEFRNNKWYWAGVLVG